MTNWKRITAWFILAAVIIIIGYDAFVMYKAGNTATISHFMYTEAFKVPAIPFAWGLLMGHFFL